MRVLDIKVLFVSIVLILSGCSDPMTDQEHVRKAKEYYSAGDIRECAIELKNALQKNSSNIEARWLLGKAYIAIGNGFSAEKELKKAKDLGMSEEALVIPVAKSLLLQGEQYRLINNIHPLDKQPNHEKAYVMALRSYAHIELKEFDKAKDELNAARSISEEVTFVDVIEARLLMAKGQHKVALQLMMDTVKKDPDSSDAWGMLGDIQRFIGKVKEAETSYSQAITINQYNNSSFRVQRAMMRIALQDFAGANEDLEKLKAIAPRNPRIFYIEGALHFEKEDYKKALTAFQQVLKFDNKHKKSILLLGATNFALNQLQQAESNLMNYLQFNPGSLAAGKLLGELRIRKRDYKGAEEILLSTLYYFPNDIVLLKLMGSVSLAKGDSKSAIYYLERVIEHKPDFADARINLGLSYFAQGERELGMKMLSEAKDLSPDSGRADSLIILSYLQAREFDKAIELSDKLAKMIPDSVVPMNFKGLAYLGKNDEGSASKIFNKVLKLSPGDPEATINLASMRLKSGDHEGAKKLFQDSLAYYPDNPVILSSIAGLEESKGGIKESREKLESLVKKFPAELKPAILLAKHYLRTSLPAQAYQVLQRMEPSFPANRELITEMGNASLALGDFPMAISFFTRLVKMDPGSVGGHYLLAKAYRNMGDNKRVRKHLDIVLGITPDHLPSRIALATLLINQKEIEKADKIIKNLARDYPERADILALNAWAAMSSNRTDEAITAYKKALERNPDNDMVIALAKMQWKSGNKKDAELTLKAWIEKYPQDYFVYFVLAGIYEQAGDARDAIDLYEKILRQEPDHVLAMNNLAWLIKDKNPDRAFELADRAVQLAPNVAAFMDTLGVLALENKQVERSIRLLSRAAEIASGDLSIQYHYAKALSHRGDIEKALVILDRVLKKDSELFSQREEAELLKKELMGR